MDRVLGAECNKKEVLRAGPFQRPKGQGKDRYKTQQQVTIQGPEYTSKASQQVRRAGPKESGLDWGSWAAGKLWRGHLVGRNNRSSGSRVKAEGAL